jgi:hypothetical protein
MSLDGSVRVSMATTSVARIDWLSLSNHPRFRNAVLLNAALILAHKDHLSATIKWLTNDAGRASTLNRVHQIHGRRKVVSVGDVLERARPRQTASRGGGCLRTMLPPAEGPTGGPATVDNALL